MRFRYVRDHCLTLPALFLRTRKFSETSPEMGSGCRIQDVRREVCFVDTGNEVPPLRDCETEHGEASWMHI